MTRAWTTVGIAALAMAASGSCSLFGTATQVVKTAQTAGHVVGKLTDLTKDLTPENEYFVGRSVATNILAKHDYRYLDADDIAQGRMRGATEYTNEIGHVIVASVLATSRAGDRPAPLAGWHFVIVESDSVNAFAAPGGFVFVSVAALKLARSEDELAFVLAHEVAHVVRGHALGTIKKARYADISKDALQTTGALSGPALGELTQLLEGAIDDMIDAFFVKGYSKDTEYEADQVALSLIVDAGYDPTAATAYLTRMAAGQDTGSGGFYQTHPKAQDRIDRLQAKIGGAAPVTIPKARAKRFALAVKKLH